MTPNPLQNEFLLKYDKGVHAIRTLSSNQLNLSVLLLVDLSFYSCFLPL